MKDLRCFQPDQTRYELEELLGEGLNSKVYRALRVDSAGCSHQRVALKFLKDQTAVSFLRREFETLRSVRSTYCARVISWETQNGEPALSMEWIDGVNLHEFARQRSVSSAVADEIARQIYLGLLDLRAAGVFHGDLHPRNVMLDRRGQVRLIDFGSGRTADGFLQATPAFAAPEVRASGALSFAADLFALGRIRETIAPRNARSRCARSLLHTDPRKRSFACPQENQRVQREIAIGVEAILTQQRGASTQIIAATVPEPAPSIPSLLRTAVVGVLILLSMLTLAVRAEAPSETEPANAKIVVTSTKWARLALNGRDIGFAPLQIGHLRAGRHRLAWKTARAEGETRFDLSAGQTVRLGETRAGGIEVR